MPNPNEENRPKPLREGPERKGGVNERPQRPKPPIRPAPQNPSQSPSRDRN